MSSVDVSTLVLTTAALLNSDTALSRVRIDVEGSSPPLAADAELLMIVFLNLLVNSAHAKRGEGRIQVTIGVEDGHCRVAVADAGDRSAAARAVRSDGAVLESP